MVRTAPPGYVPPNNEGRARKRMRDGLGTAGSAAAASEGGGEGAAQAAPSPAPMEGVEHGNDGAQNPPPGGRLGGTVGGAGASKKLARAPSVGGACGEAATSLAGMAAVSARLPTSSYVGVYQEYQGVKRGLWAAKQCGPTGKPSMPNIYLVGGCVRAWLCVGARVCVRVCVCVRGCVCPTMHRCTECRCPSCSLLLVHSCTQLFPRGWCATSAHMMESAAGARARGIALLCQMLP